MSFKHQLLALVLIEWLGFCHCAGEKKDLDADFQHLAQGGQPSLLLTIAGAGLQGALSV